MATRLTPIELTQTTRRDWAKEWNAKLSAMFDTPAKKDTQGRVWRMRWFADDGDYLVATLVETITPPPGMSSDQVVKVAIFLTRPYTRATLGGASVVTMQLVGQYSTDEIVAFLRLDTVDPAENDWRDETRYSNIITVGNIVAKHMRND